MERNLYIIFLLIYFTSEIKSQELNQFTIQSFTTENGLPSNGIKGLQWEEKTGFLWLATEAGVVRFNGMNFKIL